MRDNTGQPCAQPICRHSRDDHLYGIDDGCRLCKCSEYVSRRRMFGRRAVWAILRSVDVPH